MQVGLAQIRDRERSLEDERWAVTGTGVVLFRGDPHSDPRRRQSRGPEEDHRLPFDKFLAN